MCIFVSRLDFLLYRRAHNVFEKFKLTSFQAKFIAGTLNLARNWPWVISEHYGLCIAEARFNPSQTSRMELFAKYLTTEGYWLFFVEIFVLDLWMAPQYAAALMYITRLKRNVFNSIFSF